PGNLLRSRDGEVKLADFGIAKATEQSSITQVGSVLGTAAYLAPEQARGEEAGPSADLYALGVVTYQLISGRLPYAATSLTELALKQQREQPPLLDTLVAAVTPELAEAVAIALALDPRDRYSTALEMGHALGNGVRGIAPQAGPRGGRGSIRRAASGRGRVPMTSATTVLAGARGPKQPSRTVAPRRPRPGPARTSAALVPAARPASSSPRRRASRLLVALLALLVVVLVVVVVVVVVVVDGAPAPTKVVLRKVVYSDVQQTTAALEKLVSENTQ
ncbi:MAG: protein kinase domain-containing protein, partial [Solirubrobacteraceae bacterium]